MLVWRTWFGTVLLSLAAATAAGAAASDIVTEVVEPYLEIQTALVNDTLGPVPDGARRIVSGARGLGEPGKGIVEAAATLAKAGALEAARSAFATLSTALIDYADQAGIALPDHVVAYCPMADASWVQKGMDVANPYYGAAMRTCGTVTRPLSR